VVGLQDGQSEENIIFEDKDRNNGTNGTASGFQIYSQFQPQEETPYYTSIINLGRRQSAVSNLGGSEIFVGVSAQNSNGVIRR